MFSGVNVGPLGDIGAMVDKLMVFEARDLTRFKAEKVAQQTQMKGFDSLKGLFTTLNTNITALQTAFNTVSYQVTSSDTSKLTAQITNNLAGQGTHTILASKLAKAEVYRSQTFSSATTPLSLSQAETLNIAVGTSNINVSINQTDTLQMIRDRINNTASSNSLGVTASILSTNDGMGVPQYQLVVSSTETGLAKKAVVTDPQNLFTFSETVAAQNAEFTFDGNSVIRSSNTVSDVLDGLTFTLLDANVGTPVSSTINISQSTTTRNESIKTAMGNFVTSYNAIIAAIDANQANPATENETYKLIKVTLGNAAQAIFTSGATESTLSSFGIKTSQAKELYIQDGDNSIKYYSTGSLELDTTVYSAFNSTLLDNAINNNFTSLKSALFDQTGILKNMSFSVEHDINSQVGAIGLESTSLVEKLSGTEQKIIDETSRLMRTRSQLMDKYSMLNSMLDKMARTGDYLTKQFDALSAAMKR